MRKKLQLHSSLRGLRNSSVLLDDNDHDDEDDMTLSVHSHDNNSRTSFESPPLSPHKKVIKKVRRSVTSSIRRLGPHDEAKEALSPQRTVSDCTTSTLASGDSTSTREKVATSPNMKMMFLSDMGGSDEFFQRHQTICQSNGKIIKSAQLDSPKKNKRRTFRNRGNNSSTPLTPKTPKKQSVCTPMVEPPQTPRRLAVEVRTSRDKESAAFTATASDEAEAEPFVQLVLGDTVDTDTIDSSCALDRMVIPSSVPVTPKTTTKQSACTVEAPQTPGSRQVLTVAVHSAKDKDNSESSSTTSTGEEEEADSFVQLVLGNAADTGTEAETSVDTSSALARMVIPSTRNNKQAAAKLTSATTLTQPKEQTTSAGRLQSQSKSSSSSNAKGLSASRTKREQPRSKTPFRATTNATQSTTTVAPAEASDLFVSVDTSSILTRLIKEPTRDSDNNKDKRPSKNTSASDGTTTRSKSTGRALKQQVAAASPIIRVKSKRSKSIGRPAATAVPQLASPRRDTKARRGAQ